MELSATPSSPPAGASSAAATLVRHFPAEVRDAYARFQENRSPADADVVIAAAVLDHLPDKKRCPNSALPDQLSLIADLGFDSIAITELVFFLEDLFRVRISNDEILSVKTVGDLRAFVRKKLTAVAPPTGA